MIWDDTKLSDYEDFPKHPESHTSLDDDLWLLILTIHSSVDEETPQ